MKCDDCVEASTERFGCKKLNLLFSNGYMAAAVSDTCDSIPEESLERLRLYYGTLDSVSSPFFSYKVRVMSKILE